MNKHTLRSLFDPSSACISAAAAATLLAASSARAQFTDAEAFATSSGAPTSVSIGDLTNNGWLDIAVATQSPNEIRFLYNDPQRPGRFTWLSGPPVSLSDTPQSVVVADLDGMHGSDLIVRLRAAGGIAIVRSTGWPNFAAPTIAVTGSIAASAVVDMNGDGNLDLAVVRVGSSDVSFYANNGSGGFSASGSYTTSIPNPSSITIGDWNSDDLDDLVVHGDAPRVELLLNGSSLQAVSFTQGWSSNIGSGSRKFVGGDFDQDGDADLAMAPSQGSGVAFVALLIGNGTGVGFLPSTGPATGARTIGGFVVGDIDRKNGLDFLILDDSAEEVVSLRNDGSAGFASWSRSAVGASPSDVAIADLDRDGYPEVVTADEGSRSVSMLNNLGMAHYKTGGPAVAMPVAVNLTTASGPETLLFKRAGLESAPPVQIRTPLQGPGMPDVTPEALRWQSSSWRRQPSAAGPILWGHSMTYDWGGGQVLSVGGTPSGPDLEMWGWDGCAWTRLTPAPLPSSRLHTAVASDVGSAVFMFGGFGYTGLPNNESWSWNGASWTLHSPAVSPSPRGRHAMAYDVGRGRVVMFGGATNIVLGVAFGDTWEWDISNGWVQVAPPTTPSARHGHAMAYDSHRHKVVLFGGRTSEIAAPMGDTWEFDGVSWVQVSTTGPSARFGSAMVYDPVRRRTVLTGGGQSPLFPFFRDLETWEWDGLAWVQLPALPGLLDRGDHAMTYDPLAEELVVHGGLSFFAPLIARDTWTLENSARSLSISSMSLGLDFVPYDVGDPGLADVPDGSWIGMAFSVRGGSQGTTGSRIAEEHNGNGSNLFHYLMDRSDPNCVPPGTHIGAVTLAADANEGLITGSGAQEISGVDVFLPVYNTLADPGFPVPALRPDLNVYFTVDYGSLGQTPASWFGGAARRSAASILVTRWDPTARSWSCPEVWLAYDEIEIGGSLLQREEIIDALAIGRNDFDVGPPEFVVFSTCQTRGDGAPTVAPDQLMSMAAPGHEALVQRAVPYLAINSRTNERVVVSRRIGADPTDDIDGACIFDPCTTGLAGRAMFDRARGRQISCPLLFSQVLNLPIGVGNSAAYREDVGGTDQFTTVMTGHPGSFALWMLALTSSPLAIVAAVSPVVTAGSARVQAPITPALIGLSITTYWLSADLPLLDVRCSAIEFRL